MSDPVNGTASYERETEPQAPLPPPDAPPKPRREWDLAGWTIFILGVGSVIFGFVAAVGSGFGFWDWNRGILWVHWSGYLAAAVAVFAIFVGWRTRKAGANPPRFRRWLGTLASIGYVGWLMTYVIAGWSVPQVHDVSTDIADPPEFRVLALRADNWDKIPGADDPKMRGMTPRQRWALLLQKSYGDIRSVRMAQPVPEVVEKAERLADDRGWEIAVTDPAQGRLEATETSPLFRFKEDIVLRVRPTEDGQGSLVDMRSVSRVGQNDQGTNAKRIRAFLADLSGTVSPR